MSLLVLGRQVAVKGEVLAAQPGAHQGEKDGRRPDAGHDPNLAGVCQVDELCARVGNRRASGFRDQTKVMAGQERCEQRRELVAARVFVEFGNLDLLDGLCAGKLFEESASRLGVFGDEVVKALCDAAHLAGEDVVQRAVAERDRDQVQGTFLGVVWGGGHRGGFR